MLSGAMSRYSVYSTDGESYGSIQTIEVSRLIKLLSIHMLHHDFEKSAEIMEALIMRSSEAGELSMKCSREIMLHDMERDKDVFEKLLKFERQQYVSAPQFRIENMLERVFLLVHHDCLEEAHQVLQKNVNFDPHRHSPLIRGYAGVIAYVLWKKQSSQQQTMELETAESDKKVGEDMYSGIFIKQFEDMMKCIKPNEGVYNYFLSVYVQGLIELEKHENAIVVVEDYIIKQPHDLIAHRLLIKLLGMLPESSENKTKLIQTKQKLAQLDPSCPEVIPLARVFLIEHEYCKCFELLLKFLDYPINKHSTEAWSLLEALKQKWPEYIAKPQWISRQRHWKKLHGRV